MINCFESVKLNHIDAVKVKLINANVVFGFLHENRCLLVVCIPFLESKK